MSTQTPTADLSPEGGPDIPLIVSADATAIQRILTEKQTRLLTQPLQNAWSAPDNEPFVVMADVPVFYSIYEPPVVPKVLLATAVRQGTDLTEHDKQSYFLWTRGKAPDVAVEIVSNRDGGEDSFRLRTYARIRVPYYVVFDPENLLSGGVLQVFMLHAGRYRRLAGPYELEGIGLGVRLWDGLFEGIHRTWLRWCDRAGNVIPTDAERA